MKPDTFLCYMYNLLSFLALIVHKPQRFGKLSEKLTNRNIPVKLLNWKCQHKSGPSVIVATLLSPSKFAGFHNQFPLLTIFEPFLYLVLLLLLSGTG